VGAGRSFLGRAARWVLFHLVLLALFCLGLEVYLRRTTTHVVEEHETSVLSRRFLLSTERLIRQTPQGRRLIPNARVVIKNHGTSGRDVHVRINSLGFRDDEIPVVKRPGEARILVLGDSITWGDYIEAEEVYVERMQQQLRRLLPDRPIEVINAGVGDVGLAEEIAILKETGLKVEPDVVMVAFYLNDSRPPWGFSGELGSRGWLRRHSLLAETLYKQLKVAQWLRSGGEDRVRWANARTTLDWKHDRAKLLELASLANFDWGAAWVPSSWELIDRELAELKRLSEENHFKVAIVSFPVSYQVYADFLEDAPQRTMEGKAHALGFAYFDLLPLLREHKDDNLYFDHCHPREEANTIIGQAIAEFVQREKLLARE
jgi:lysophospholipase L1-like esterase